uniref:Sulfatase N-terminal domain-containing protein n=1 Tax=Eubacterium plexicaudatum ASF492 TaxID=1235802 RepID=N2AHM1_9FIRM
MYFELLFIISAGISLFHSEFLNNKTANVRKTHMAVLILSPVFFILCSRRLFTIREMLSGCAFAFFIGKGMHLRMPKCDLSVSKYFRYGVKVLFAILLYILLLKPYTPAEGEMSREPAVLFFLAVTVIWILAGQIRTWVAAHANCLHMGIAAPVTPVLGFYLMEKVYNPYLDRMEGKYIAGNLLWLACLFAVPYVVFAGKRIVMGMFVIGCLLFGLGNYYVSCFRGSPVMPSDLLAAATALQVAGGYVFQVPESVIKGVLCWYAWFALLCCLPKRSVANRWKGRAVASGLLAGICAGYLCQADIESRYELHLRYDNQWNINGVYQEKGSALGFTALAKNIRMARPDGYGTDMAVEILSANRRQAEEPAVIPTIVAIMDESFGDLRAVGDFQCSEEYLKHWYAVDDFLCRGSLYASVYGGTTANTEFEFLTGNSIGNLPMGIVPYQIYNMKHVGNLAGILQRAGFETTAIHPESKGNWNRMRVYENFGFRSFLGKDELGDMEYFRGRVSDQSSFAKVTERFENGTGRQFLFNITMQNHGGYEPEGMEAAPMIRLEEEQGRYSDVEVYLTGIRESDLAIDALIRYFRQVEEPVLLCIFGDHLPNVGAWMEETIGEREAAFTLEEKQRMYAVPYMIWANYDTPYQSCEMDTSANYLGAMLLNYAGIPGTAYTDFLLEMRKEVPVYNAFGYRTADGRWHTFDEETQVSGWIRDYRMVQYYEMFDKERKKEEQ